MYMFWNLCKYRDVFVLLAIVKWMSIRYSREKSMRIE